MIDNPFSLEDKIILVTGASSGIGRSVALRLAKFGAKLIISGRNEERLSNVEKLIGSDSTIVVAGDLNNQETIDKIIDSCSHIDGVVHSAGLLKLLPFKSVTLEALNEMMEVNFTSPTRLSLALAKKKKLLSGASIVYITSINGAVVGSKANSMYAASKGALTGMMKAMAIDLAKNRIRVNSIAPGMIETEGTLGITNQVSEESILEDIKKYPLGRYGKPDDVANACIYLLSQASSWVTGTTIIVDGGFTTQ